MEQICLSIDQMKHLESLGLDTSDASHFYGDDYVQHDLFVTPKTEDEDLAWDELKKAGGYSAYTLQDILLILPKFIVVNNRKHYLTIHTVSKGESIRWSCFYFGNTINKGKQLHVCPHYKGNNLFECVHRLLLWCIKNGYIKTNKV